VSSDSDIIHSSRRASELVARFEKRGVGGSGQEQGGRSRASASGFGPPNPSIPSLCRSSSPAMATLAPDRAALTVGPGMDMPIMHDSDHYETSAPATSTSRASCGTAAPWSSSPSSTSSAARR
jgi:hypothetical protein